MGLSGWIIGGIASSPIGGTLLWHTWELSIRPRLIPAGEMRALADELIIKHGPRAEEIALIEEDRAWRYSEICRDPGRIGSSGVMLGDIETNGAVFGSHAFEFTADPEDQHHYLTT